MLAFTFPGQGSQRQGMGRAWVDHPSWEVVGEASAVAGRDLARLLLDADQDELTLTANAQLATYVLGLVVLDAIERVGIEPTACAGHSLGEYTALTAAGALGFEDGVRLVVERGEAMHHAAEERPGTMAAVLGADDDAVEAACQRAEGEVWVANYNAPGQVVIAGTEEAVAVAGTIAKELGARRVMPFPVAGAFHTALMAPARSRLRKALADTPFSAPEVPVVANIDARSHPGSDEWPGLLSAQLCGPVRWRQSLLTLSELGTTQVVEVGPGGVLTGLARRTLPEAQALSVASPDDLGGLVETLSGSETWHAYAAAHQGEHLYTSERVVVSPAVGVFSPDPGLAAPAPGGLTSGGPAGGPPEIDPGVVDVGVGALLGQVGDIEVRTPFAGHVVGFMAHAGERVVTGQPLAWLRVQHGPVSPGDDEGSPGPRPSGPGRVVLVTGGSRGIGLACARRFQALGDRVAVTYRSSAPDPGGPGADDPPVLAVPCDVTDPAQVETAFAQVEEALGPVEILVANAGITKDMLLLRMKEDDWSEVIDTNLTGVYRTVRRALGPMVRAHRGRIVIVSSVVGFLGSAGQVNYAASKAGLVGLARSLAREVGSRGITVNVVAPGMVDTDMIATLGDQRMEQLRSMIPLGRTATPDEVTGAVVFLSSEDAAYVTGVVLAVDGGLAMGL